MINNQKDLRSRYAERRRKSIYKKTFRVKCKSKSDIVAQLI